MDPNPFAARRLKLRFEVNQAEAYRLGVDCPKPMVTLTINPVTLNAKQRRLLADRLVGNDVCEAVLRIDGTRGPAVVWKARTDGHPESRPLLCRLVASLPTLESLFEALEADERRIEEQWQLRLQSTSSRREFSHYSEALAPEAL